MNGDIIPVLAERFSIDEAQNSKAYRFTLRKDVTWHDGERLKASDVEATFKLIKELGQAGIQDIYAAETMKDVEIEVLDNYVFRFTVTERTIPNFYELINFKILPGHLIEQYRNAILSGQFTGNERLKTVGTGPYRLTDIKTDNVVMSSNKKYYLGTPKIDQLVFRLFRSDSEALQALKSGQVHGITNITTDLSSELRRVPNLELVSSSIIYSQYWGIYFNLSEKGPTSIKDKRTRQGFSAAINREFAVQRVYDKADVALGPIPSNSPYYASDKQQPSYDRELARKRFSEAGWKLNAERLLEKDGKVLELTLTFADNEDRANLVESIISDLAVQGVKVIPKPTSPQELLDVRVRGDFELLLMGVSTFIDPDRYEFFHSTQSGTDSGLNISSYKSARTISDLVERDGKTVVERIPLVDKMLDEGRKRSEFVQRKEKYDTFQEIIADEVPVVFLFHPSLRYIVHKRVKNVSLENVRLLEDRFHSVKDWEIIYN
jgi:ABC-type transport system substrate-binding protein